MQAFHRRKLLVGGGVGVGLLVAWSLWPRQYQPNLRAAKGEHLFGPWLKIAEDGKVIIAIPQSESGQGVYTALAQIVAGELGADWRSVAVQPVSASPVFANDLAGARMGTGIFAETPVWHAKGGSGCNGIIGELADARYVCGDRRVLLDQTVRAALPRSRRGRARTAVPGCRRALGYSIGSSARPKKAL